MLGIEEPRHRCCVEASLSSSASLVFIADCTENGRGRRSGILSLPLCHLAVPGGGCGKHGVDGGSGSTQRDSGGSADAANSSSGDRE